MGDTAKCAIYEKRPQLCKDYPTVYHYMPPECTYYFVGSERRGECNCGVAACCNVPRENGEPGGAPIPSETGGEPCKHIEWEPVMEKEASDESIASESPLQDAIRRDMGW